MRFKPALVGVLLCLMTLAYWRFFFKPLPSLPNPPESSTISESLPQYSIRSFREKVFAPSTIQTERLVRETTSFRSYVVSFVSDNLKQYALMNVPTQSAPQDGFPVVIVNHGYIDPDVYSTENSYINTSAYFAQNGFLVVKPDYRGHDQSEGEARKFFSRMDYALDVSTLLASLTTLPLANENKIFMYGHSMGGDVTLRLMEISDRITAATLWAPAVTDFPESHLYFTRKNRPEDLSRSRNEFESILKPDEYDAVSIIENVSLVNAPLLIHHGTRDESVPFSWGENLYSKLKAADKQVVFYSYQGDNHDIANNFTSALSRDVAFFRSFLD